MKRKIFIGLLALIMCFTLTACGDNNSSSKMSNDIIKIDGIYLNNEYTDDDGLKQIVLFYTLTANDENISISSAELKLKIDKNEYFAINGVDTPNLTQYYYSNIVETVYVGKTLKVAAIFNVPDGDLVSGKEITFTNYDDYADGIKINTDDIKKMDNLTSISLDVDNEYAIKMQNEEKEKLIEVDEATANKVKNDINGYYFDIPAYVGTVYTKYKLEFEEPNKFVVTATISGNSISNTGTYTVTKGYIVLHYDTGKDVNTPYNYENGDITIDSPFYSNGSDTTF